MMNFTVTSAFVGFVQAIILINFHIVEGDLQILITGRFLVCVRNR
jgi:hypothetical protein